MRNKSQARHRNLTTCHKIGAYLLSLAFLNGCSVGPNFKPPAFKTSNYIDKKLQQVVNHDLNKKNCLTKAEEEIPKEWWKLFHSKALNQFIVKGLENSPTLEAAKAVLRQSEENIKVYTGSTLFPSISGNFSESRQRLSNANLGMQGKQKNIFNLYNASVTINYALDFFGGSKQALEGLYAKVEYQNYLVEAAYLALSANIVTAAITEASLRAQIQLAENLINLNLEQLNIAKKQFELGSISHTQLLKHEAQLAESRTALPLLVKKLAFIRHSLSTLVGEIPSDQGLPKFQWFDLKQPSKIPVSLSSMLAKQRPDIRASEALLHIASTNVGIATANLYPKISLSATFGSTTNLSNQLFKSETTVWNYGAQIIQPIFFGGSLRAKRKVAQEAYKEAEARYKETVLKAFQDVADTLRALETDKENLKIKIYSECIAKDALKIAEQQYTLGAINYLELLNVKREYQLARISRIQAEAVRMTDIAALFQALGGGW